MSNTVGYLEGTDPLVLTRLNLRGIGTFPLGNGFDGHGKYVGHITKNDDINVVIGYLHKIMPARSESVEPRDFLWAAHTNNIPVLIIVPGNERDSARQFLDEAIDWLTLVAPDEVFDKVMQHCKV